MELLELEMRARAIEAFLMKDGKADNLAIEEALLKYKKKKQLKEEEAEGNNEEAAIEEVDEEDDDDEELET